MSKHAARSWSCLREDGWYTTGDIARVKQYALAYMENRPGPVQKMVNRLRETLS